MTKKGRKNRPFNVPWHLSETDEQTIGMPLFSLVWRN